ncbi:hypothetical protein KEJ18_00930 [Candidatus Bathyarchaeota archaeon]|nr:hypothetical protein [Candidatus Bathyarchaeota archaeon]
MMEVKVTLNKTAPKSHIDLTDLIERSNGNSRSELIRLIEERQERIIRKLCGLKYSRSHPYRRGSTYTKTLITGVGTVRFKVKRVISRTDSSVSTPILEALDVKRRKYSRDVRMKLAEFASKMTYQDASLEFETATGVHVPKRTILSFVQEIAPPLLEANKTNSQPGIVMGDTAKVRALKSREMNMVHVLLSDGGQLLHLGVNGMWPSSEAGILVSDNEPGLTNAVNAERRHLCILHALKYLLFTLWGEGMSKEDRIEVERAVKQALFTLVNSTKKHLKDGDKERLKARIDAALKELHSVAEELEDRGYTKASTFITRNARFMVTFAELALEDIQIPYTTNKIERLMGEVSKRCKHKWMRWSTNGLRNILAIILVRYTNKHLYQSFKKAYIHNKPFIKQTQRKAIL